jgi:hypothetical protein
LAQCIAQSFTHRALWQGAPGEEPTLQDSMDSLAEGRALTGAISLSQRWASLLMP